MSKRFLLDNCILEAVNKYGITVNDLEDSIQELLYCALYCDYVPKCKLVVVEDYKTTLTALGELARIYNIRGELAAWVLIELWEVLDEDKNLVECITNGKYFAKIQKAITKYKDEAN